MTEVSGARAVADGRRARDRYRGWVQRVRLRFGAINVLYDPLEIYVGGIRIPVSPLEATTLELLVRRGRASSEEWRYLFEQDGASVRAFDVHVHRIRRKFQEAELFDPSETVRGWRLKLADLSLPSREVQQPDAECVPI